MFLEREITPELAIELKRQKIVIAHSVDEVLMETKNHTEEDLDTTALGAASDLDYILRQWKRTDSWAVLKGLRVLDLASGSSYSRDMFGMYYYPHFSRICAINGADVVAVDAKPQWGLDQTMFMWDVVDLVDAVLKQGLKDLSILKEKEFDIVYSSGFVGYNSYPDLIRQLANHGAVLDEFKKVFLQQAGELLANGGVMSLGSMSKEGLPILHTRRGADIVQLTQARRRVCQTYFVGGRV